MCRESHLDYNDSSVVVFSSTDNGLITNAVTVTEDNGSIADPLTAGEESNGTVLYDQTVTGTTGGITLSLTRDPLTQAEIDEFCW